MAFYETKQAILEEAGLIQPVLADALSGTVDGSNRVFTTGRKPLADTNYDDIIDTSDVHVYVNGTPVTVSSINAASGQITLATAPAFGATVTADYSYSAISDAQVTKVREEAQQAINDRMDASDDTVPYVDPVPATVRKITRYLAGGLLLMRDYGFNTSTENTSKDGAMKYKMAEAWLADYVAIGGSTGLSDVSAADPSVSDGGSLFSTTYTPDYTHDANFMIDPFGDC